MIRNGVLFLKPDRPLFSISYAHSEEDLEKLLELTETFVRKNTHG